LLARAVAAPTAFMRSYVIDRALLERPAAGGGKPLLKLGVALGFQRIDAVGKQAAVLDCLVTCTRQRDIVATAQADVVGLAVAGEPENPRSRVPLRNLQVAAVTNGVAARLGELGDCSGGFHGVSSSRLPPRLPTSPS
jgi:hypothetical protein